MVKTKLVKHVCEVRYEGGYRYLDRCGETLLILEDVLPNETGVTWMPEETLPTGARLKCPELDVVVVFDSTKMLVDQSYDANASSEKFSSICDIVLATLKGRLDLKTITRLGSRRMSIMPTASSEDAEQSSVAYFPAVTWQLEAPAGSEFKQAEATIVCENAAHDGWRFSYKPVHQADAPQSIDERLFSPTHLLPKGQKDALREQLARRAKMEKSPPAGLFLDVDYYWVRPAKVDLKAFLKQAIEDCDKIVANFFNRKKQ